MLCARSFFFYFLRQRLGQDWQSRPTPADTWWDRQPCLNPALMVQFNQMRSNLNVLQDLSCHHLSLIGCFHVMEERSRKKQFPKLGTWLGSLKTWKFLSRRRRTEIFNNFSSSMSWKNRRRWMRMNEWIKGIISFFQFSPLQEKRSQGGDKNDPRGLSTKMTSCWQGSHPEKAKQNVNCVTLTNFQHIIEICEMLTQMVLSYLGRSEIASFSSFLMAIQRRAHRRRASATASWRTLCAPTVGMSESWLYNT